MNEIEREFYKKEAENELLRFGEAIGKAITTFTYSPVNSLLYNFMHFCCITDSMSAFNKKTYVIKDDKAFISLKDSENIPFIIVENIIHDSLDIRILI